MCVKSDTQHFHSYTAHAYYLMKDLFHLIAYFRGHESIQKCDSPAQFKIRQGMLHRLT
jgi:hypothetical protein